MGSGGWLDVHKGQPETATLSLRPPAKAVDWDGVCSCLPDEALHLVCTYIYLAECVCFSGDEAR